MALQDAATIEPMMVPETTELKVCTEEAAMLFQGHDSSREGRFSPPDGLDEASVLLTPAFSSVPLNEVLRADAEKLFSEGVRGPLARSFLSRDLAAARVHLRSLETRLDFALRQLARGRGDERRVRLLSDLTDRAHRRFVASAELFLRLDNLPTPSFRIAADRAAFLISDSASGRQDMG